MSREAHNTGVTERHQTLGAHTDLVMNFLITFARRSQNGLKWVLMSLQGLKGHGSSPAACPALAFVSWPSMLLQKHDLHEATMRGGPAALQHAAPCMKDVQWILHPDAEVPLLLHNPDRPHRQLLHSGCLARAGTHLSAWGPVKMQQRWTAAAHPALPA